MESIDINDYVCGGYFLTKRIDRSPHVSDLMPDSFLTLSNCFTGIAAYHCAASSAACIRASVQTH